MDKRKLMLLTPLILVTVFILSQTLGVVSAQPKAPVEPPSYATAPIEEVPGVFASSPIRRSRISAADREAAAARDKLLRMATTKTSPPFRSTPRAVLNPGGTPDYFGTTPNYALSPPMRKFVDSLAGLGAAGANNLGNYIPVAVPDTTTYADADYYVIALVEYTQKMNSDLPPTTLRGYVQRNNSDTANLTPPSYLGPAIVAHRDRPVRIKFINKLPTGAGGQLFLPVDTTLMGAGMGPLGTNVPAGQPVNYTQNRATLHLHGGLTPWISDGTPHQWTTPANESTPYQKGVSVRYVPDMDGGNEPTGTLTFYYTNQQSARLMFYHDHSYGITRLNVYAGEAAPYLLDDPVEQKLVNGGSFKNASGTTVTVAPSTIPTEQVPLVIQDKTFVPTDTALAAQDPTWPFGGGHMGGLWLPHVYMPNQDPWDSSGINAMGRWDYNPWFYPPQVGQTNPPVTNPLYDPILRPWEPPQNPGTPNPTLLPEAFLDTPVVNGTAYPYTKVERKAYRFRILNACNDRYLNLQLYFAKSNTPDSVDSSGNPTLQTNSGEVSMTPAIPHPGDPSWPSTWPTDGRDGGVPDPTVAGPKMIQIGNEGGIIPSATVLPNTPVGYEYFRRTITVLNVTNKTLYLGPAERADVIVDFSQVPNGSKLILYNDAPAPMPAFDSRVDYYTGDPDQSSSGGATSTVAGYGPNTRTVMQFKVDSTVAASAFDVGALQTGLQAAYGATQDKPIVPESAYGPAFGKTYPNLYATGIDTGLTFTPDGTTTPLTMAFRSKAVIEGFDMMYGRMNAQLGGTLPNAGPLAGAAVPYSYVDPPTEQLLNSDLATPIGSLGDGTQLWRVDHMGVDTHSIHFHLHNVQLINRVAIDGQVFPPDANELGWKETVRMNPGQSVILALRPDFPANLPWKLPDSIRLLDPSKPAGATWSEGNTPRGATITNVLTNFGWEYVWHCHLLGHEENDMMRPIQFLGAPKAPSALTQTRTGASQATLRWTNNATLPAATDFLVQRATNSAFTSNVTSFTTTGVTAVNNLPTTGTFYYRVRAETTIGYSAWSNTVVSAQTVPNAPTGLAVTSKSRTSISLRWTIPAGGPAISYQRLQRSTVGATGPWTNSGSTLGAAARTGTVAGLTRNTRYWLRVVAVNGSGQSPSNVVVSVTRP